MPAEAIAIVSPGDMGHHVGRALKTEGRRILTCLEGRSARTRGLAEAAGFESVPTLAELLAQADLVLSILPPSNALDSARTIARTMAESGAKPAFADCNAISPRTTHEIGALMAGIGAPYIDAGIIGPGPGTREQPTRFYVSGPGVAAMDALRGPHIEVIEMGPEIGRASAIKMCYAAVTKGTWTLHAAALMAAEALGVSPDLHAEFQYSQAKAYAEMARMVPRLPLDAGRWIGEMHEIGDTLDGVGVTPRFHRGAAEVFELLVRTPVARETRETVDPNRSLEQALAIFFFFLPSDRNK